MKAMYSIRYKFLLVSTSLLILCVGLYLVVAMGIFKNDKIEFVFGYNQSLVSSVASDVDQLFRGVTDKVKLLAYWVANEDRNKSKSDLFNDLFGQTRDVVFVATSERVEAIESVIYQDSVYASTYQISDAFFLTDLARLRPVPFERILQHGVTLWNASIKGGPPLIGYGKLVIEENSQGRPERQYAVVAYVSADKILKSLREARLNQGFLANEFGEILVHVDPLEMVGEVKRSHTILDRALADPLRTSVAEFADQGKKWLGAFSKTYDGHVVVLSQVDEDRAFAAVQHLIYRSILLALIALTLAFIAAILFSRSLTRPLDTLVAGMNRVKLGDLETQIEVQSRDEMSLLAHTFNQMIGDLRDSRVSLEALNRDLEKKVQQRTSQLEQQNLAVKKAQEALLKSSKLAAMGEVAGQVAHEVLNPLTTLLSRAQQIKERVVQRKEQENPVLHVIAEGWAQDYSQGGWAGLAESLQKSSTVESGKTVGEEDLENLKKIDQSFSQEWQTLIDDVSFVMGEGRRIERIVGQMRSMSVVKADLKPHDLDRVVQRSLDIMADLVRQQAVQVTVVNHSPGKIVLVDDEEFVQCMTNLIRNSIQAMAERQSFEKANSFEGRIVVEIASQQEGRTSIAVTDNGVGIKEHDQRNLFALQFSTKPRDQGTGLGLTISRRIVRAFNGDLYLKSSGWMRGTTFVIELPQFTDIEGRVSA